MKEYKLNKKNKVKFEDNKEKSSNETYSVLTYKVKHYSDLSFLLENAIKVANYALKCKENKELNKLSSKYVRCYGLPSCISNQILRKYGKSKKIKKIKSVKLTVPGQSINTSQYKLLSVPCLDIELEMPYNYIKINQIEFGSEYAYISYTIKDEPLLKSQKWIGIDRNAKGHVAVCAIDDKILKLGKQCLHIKRKYKKLRNKAQKYKKYKFLKKINHKENRIINDINHKISRKIVNVAKEKSLTEGVNYGIKLEYLRGIRENTNKKNKNKESKSITNNWNFYKLEQYIKYKAKICGIEVAYVAPYYTSQTCSKCGLLGKRDDKTFICPYCGHHEHADANAAFNISKADIIDINKLKKKYNKGKSNGSSNIDRDMFDSTTDSAKEEIVLNVKQPTSEPPKIYLGE